jgi:hypothetical protein
MITFTTTLKITVPSKQDLEQIYDKLSEVEFKATELGGHYDELGGSLEVNDNEENLDE